MGATSPRPFSTRPDCTEHVRDLEDDCFTRMCCTEAIENGFIAANPEAMHEPCRELRQLWKTIYIADDMLSFAGVVSAEHHACRLHPRPAHVMNFAALIVVLHMAAHKQQCSVQVLSRPKHCLP